MSLRTSLLLVALTFFPQEPQSCNGDCPDGHRSVCVRRGSDCKCNCIKDVEAGVTALRDMLYAFNVQDLTIKEAQERYRELAGKERGEFSFTVYDNAGEWTIRGQGFADTWPGTVCCVGAARLPQKSRTSIR